MGFAQPTGLGMWKIYANVQNLDILELYYCFPGDATVFSNGEEKRMDELKEGDWVQALTEDGTETIRVPIKYWLHRDPSQEATFIRYNFLF